VGPSFGWINRELISSGTNQPHINAYGGEDRFWLGPEGGQFSIFFAKGAKFELANWFTPKPIDTMPWRVEDRSGQHVQFGAEFSLTNYSGTHFEVRARRKITLLSREAAWLKLPEVLGTHAKRLSNVPRLNKGQPAAEDEQGFPGTPPDDVRLVAYETDNQIINAGKETWKKERGLLSIWILGMFNPSPTTTIVVPIASGPESELGPKVNSDYFGSVPPERLVVREHAVYFSGDGQFRSKIGVSPRRSLGVIGSYDAAGHVLTVVQFTQGEGATDYVNSQWKLQEDPYKGDTANSYNDGPPAPGAKPLGPFYELESSSEAAALAPGARLGHIHRTIHLSGPEEKLDTVAHAALGVSLKEIRNALPL
jgi:hypothetical protein